MAAAKPHLLQQFVLSAFLLCLCYSANGVQCFKEKKLLNLQQFRWRQHGRHAGTTTTACLSHKSSKQTQVYHCFTLFCIVLCFALYYVLHYWIMGFLWCSGVSHTLDVGTVRSLVKNIKLRCLMVEKPEVSHTERPRICSYIRMWRIKVLGHLPTKLSW